MRIISGLIGIGVGVFLIWKTYPLVNLFGKIDWAERHLGGGFGGTYFLYKIIGLVVVILSAMYMFGIINILLGPLASVFGGLKNK